MPLTGKWRRRRYGICVDHRTIFATLVAQITKEHQGRNCIPADVMAVMEVAGSTLLFGPFAGHFPNRCISLAEPVIEVKLRPQHPVYRAGR